MEAQYLSDRTCLQNEQQIEAVKYLQPPIRMALNKETIYNCVLAITETHRHDNNSQFAIIKDSIFWGFFHDSVSKFSMELVGVYLQGIDSDTVEPVIVPHGLRRIKGGYTAVDLGNKMNWIKFYSLTHLRYVTNSVIHDSTSITHYTHSPTHPLTYPSI